MPRRPPTRRPAPHFNAGCAFGSCGDCMACFSAGDGPPSPCVKVCVIDEASGWCVGCGRSGDEIAAWPKMNAPEKRDLLIRLPARVEALKKRGVARSAAE